MHIPWSYRSSCLTTISISGAKLLEQIDYRLNILAALRVAAIGLGRFAYHYKALQALARHTS